MSEFFGVAFSKGEYFVSEDDSVTKYDTRLNFWKNRKEYFMCSTPKITNVAQDTEVIKAATQADASVQKASAANRNGVRGIISENIRTTNNGIDDEVLSSKKKLLGE